MAQHRKNQLKEIKNTAAKIKVPNNKNKRPRPVKKGRLKSTPIPSPMASLKMATLLKDTELLNFIQATTHPFGPEGVGALIPDRYDAMTIATYDPLDIEIDVSSIISYLPPDNTLTGVAAMVVPRCLAAGFFAGYQEVDDVVSTGVNVIGNISSLYVDYTMKDFSNYSGAATRTISADDIPILDPYCICILILTSQGNAIVETDENSVQTTRWGAYFMRMPRMPTILSSTTAFRIAGAGIKLNPRSAPINTGGVAFAGQVKIDTLAEKLFNNVTIGGQFSNFSNLFVGSYISSKGIAGATSRYDVFQNGEQMMKQETTISEGIFSITIFQGQLTLSKSGSSVSKYRKKPSTDSVSLDGKTQTETKNNDIIEEKKDLDLDEILKEEKKEEEEEAILYYKDKYNRFIPYFDNKPKTRLGAWAGYGYYPDYYPYSVDLSKNDLVDPGDYIPCVYYQFNSANIVPLQLRAVVHGVAEPIARLPFLSEPVHYDPLFDHVKNILSDPSVFPVNATGNSFKTALNKFSKITGKVMKIGNKANKFLKLVEGSGLF